MACKAVFLQQRSIKCASLTRYAPSRTRAVAEVSAAIGPPRQRRIRLNVQAQNKDSITEVVKSAAKVAGGLVETAADWVPSSVPRPVAKGGVAVLSSFIILGLVQKVLSTLFTLALLAGGLYVWYKSSSGDDDDDRRGRRPDDMVQLDGEDDALAEARRIMKKYK